MNYNQLHYFYMVVREGGVSAAARKLNMSQPPLSAQIKVFERNIGATLFDRRGNKLQLTTQGVELYSVATQMFELASSIPEKLSKESGTALSLKIGISNEIERPFAVNIVKSLFKEWKRETPPRITFTAGMNEDLLSKLRSWSIDAVMTNRPSSFDDLEIAGTLVMPVVFATGKISVGLKNHSMACNSKDVSKVIAKLGKGLSVPTPKLKLREETDDFMRKLRESQPIIFESDTIAAMVRAIIDNVAVGFIPLAYITREILRKEIIAFGVKEGLWKHALFLMVKRGRAEAPGISEIATAFDHLRREATSAMENISFSGKIDQFLKKI
jgi:LysR family transcriptional regulator, transcriptional activator of nhaA